MFLCVVNAVSAFMSAKSLHSCLTLRPHGLQLTRLPLSMGFSRQEYWSGLPCPPPGDLPGPGIEPTSLTSPALAGRFFITSTIWEAPVRALAMHNCEMEYILLHPSGELLMQVLTLMRTQFELEESEKNGGQRADGGQVCLEGSWKERIAGAWPVLA